MGVESQDFLFCPDCKFCESLDIAKYLYQLQETMSEDYYPEINQASFPKFVDMSFDDPLNIPVDDKSSQTVFTYYSYE